jgi:predicted ATPase with chaperone activity
VTQTDQDQFHTVDLPRAAVRGSRDRERAALKIAAPTVPPTQITINLAIAGARATRPIALEAGSCNRPQFFVDL